MKELFSALVLAQAEMGTALKDASNPFFNSKYADLTSVMSVVKPAFAKHGLGFVQIAHDAERCACIETVIIHTSGEFYNCGRVSVPVAKGDAQGYGSAMTYARRYSLAAAAAVGADDDDGNAAASAPPPPKSSATPTGGVMETLPKEMQEYLASLSIKIADHYNQHQVGAILDLLIEERLEASEHVALMSLLSSKIRTAMTKERAKRKEQAAAANPPATAPEDNTDG